MTSTDSDERPVVAHFKDNFLPPSETFIYNLISGLSRYESIVIDRYRQQNQEQFPFEAHYSPSEALGWPFGLLERATLRVVGYSPYLEFVLKRQRARLIHAHFGQLGALINPIAQRIQLPLITSFHGRDLSVFAEHGKWERHFENLWRAVTLCLALGPTMRARLVEQGCPANKVEILPVCIDTKQFTYHERKPPPQDRPLKLLTIGRLVRKKGVDTLLQAIAGLPDDVNLRLVVGGNGPQRTPLEQLAGELGIREKVEFLGWLSHREVAEQMREAHLFVLASRTDPVSGETEGTPTVLLEAQARGLPVLSTDHADIPTIMDEGRSGWLVPENDPEALTAKLLHILDSRELWPAYSRRAREFVQHRHSKEVVAARLEEYYDRCLEDE